MMAFLGRARNNEIFDMAIIAKAWPPRRGRRDGRRLLGDPRRQSGRSGAKKGQKAIV